MASNDCFIIVVGIDFSEQADQALDAALDEAAGHAHAEVHVVHVEPDAWFGSGPRHHAMGADTTVEVVRLHARERLEKRGGAPRPQRVVAHYRHGSAAEGIVRLAADLGANLVVVGSRGWGGASIFRGSVAERAARLARCSLRIVPVTGHTVVGAEPESPRSSPPSGEHRLSCASNGVHAAEMTVYEQPPKATAAPRA